MTLNTAAETCVRISGATWLSQTLGEVQQSGQREYEHEEGNDGGDDLKRDRAGISQQVMLLEPVKDRPSQLARTRPDL